LAFVNDNFDYDMPKNEVREFVTRHISSGYILDGLQRLNTLSEAAEAENFDKDRSLHLNIIIAKKYDLLLYRMITLNNGQKPMTARHQIEMLTRGAIDLSGFSLPVATEKETEGTKIPGAFRMSDIVEAYTAYLADNVNNQNKKIIESKLDEILVGRVMDSDLTETNVSFSQILSEVERLSAVPENKEWFRQVNNLIGFTVGAKRSISFISIFSPEKFCLQVEKFDKAFSSINPSKVNVGKFRRELAAFFFKEIDKFHTDDLGSVEAAFFEQTLTE